MLIGSLALTLALATLALAAFLWRRDRLRREEVSRLSRALEELRESAARRDASVANEAAPPRAATVRNDTRALETPPGPVLIAVPDLVERTDHTGDLPEGFALRFGAIWALADAGESSAAIARATQLPIGQVDLILGLRRARAHAAEPDR